MKIECKKCEKCLDFKEGLLPEKEIIELRVFLKHHRKHGIFVWNITTPEGKDDRPSGMIVVRDRR